MHSESSYGSVPMILGFTLLSPTDHSGTVKHKEIFFTIHAWFCFNGLTIIPDISEAVVFGSEFELNMFNASNDCKFESAVWTCVMIMGK